MELADAPGVRKAFKQVQDHLNGMLKVMRHNGEVVQMGFYKNDIWLETFRLMITDIAETVDEMCRDTTVQSRIRMTDEQHVDLESYWNDANETLKQKMEEARAEKAEDGTPADPVIERGDEELVIFGGDHEGDERAPSGEATEERDSGGEGLDEVRDEADSLPEVSQSSGAGATA